MKEEILKKHLGTLPGPETTVKVLLAMEEYADLRLKEADAVPLDLDRILDLRSDGCSVMYIAEVFGVSRQTIYNYLKKSGSEELPTE